MKRLFVLALTPLFALPAFAEAEIVDCSGLESVRNVVLPLADGTRTFANGKIRIWHIDTGGEPACCSSHLAIIAPHPEDELGYQQCVRLSDGGSLGFQWLSVKNIQASYDAGKGLLLNVPVERYINGVDSHKLTIGVRINQATGAIVVE